VARWIQHGTLWRIDQFIPGLAQGNYPQNGDVVSLAAVLPWHDAFAARLATGAAYAVTGVCVYALAREAGARAAGAALAGALGRLVARERLARVARDAALLAALVAAAGGIWLVRNLVESGDPAFPQPIAPFGITLFGAPPDPIRALAGFRVADYLFDGGVWD